MRADRQSVKALITLSILAFMGLAPQAKGQLILADMSLRASPQGEFARSWTVNRAGLWETFIGTRGYLDLVNATDKVASAATIYGEYFDASGRLCFSLVFSLGSNIGDKGAIAPGEVRQFSSAAPQLFPASDPTEVKLYVVNLDKVDRDPATWEVTARAPVTNIASIDTDAWRLQIRNADILGEAKVLDLAFAVVTVGKTGKVSKIDIRYAASEEVRAWLLTFARDELIFYPASEGKTFKKENALLLVRAILSEHGLKESLIPPRAVPFVRSYANGISSANLPPITEILLRVPPTRVKHMDGKIEVRPTPPPGILEVEFWNSDWSTVFCFTDDPSMPHHMGRLLAVPDQPCSK